MHRLVSEQNFNQESFLILKTISSRLKHKLPVSTKANEMRELPLGIKSLRQKSAGCVNKKCRDTNDSENDGYIVMYLPYIRHFISHNFNIINLLKAKLYPSD